MICDRPGERVHEGAQGRDDIHVSLGCAMPALVVHHDFGDAVDLGLDVAAPDVGKDPEFGLGDGLFGEGGDVAERNSLVDLTG